MIVDLKVADWIETFKYIPWLRASLGPEGSKHGIWYVNRYADKNENSSYCILFTCSIDALAFKLKFGL